MSIAERFETLAVQLRNHLDYGLARQQAKPASDKAYDVVITAPNFSDGDSPEDRMLIVGLLNKAVKRTGILTDREDLLLLEPTDVYARFRVNGTQMVISTNNFEAFADRYDHILEEVHRICLDLNKQNAREP